MLSDYQSYVNVYKRCANVFLIRDLSLSEKRSVVYRVEYVIDSTSRLMVSGANPIVQTRRTNYVSGGRRHFLNRVGRSRPAQLSSRQTEPVSWKTTTVSAAAPQPVPYVQLAVHTSIQQAECYATPYR